jgi:hypothetical protein
VLIGGPLAGLVAASGLYGSWRGVSWLERWSEAAQAAALAREAEEAGHQVAFEGHLVQERARRDQEEARASQPLARHLPDLCGWPLADGSPLCV